MCFGGRSSIKPMMETAPFEAFPILVRCDRTSARQHLLLVIWLLWGVWLLLSLHPELVVKAEGERDWEGTGAAGSQRSPVRNLGRCSYLYMAEAEKWNREVLLNTIELQSRQDNCQVTVRGRDLHLGRDICFRTAASV